MIITVLLAIVLGLPLLYLIWYIIGHAFTSGAAQGWLNSEINKWKTHQKNNKNGKKEE